MRESEEWIRLYENQKGHLLLTTSGNSCKQNFEEKTKTSRLLRSPQNTWPLQTYHQTNPFTLVVDDFGVKYVGVEHALHLLKILKQYYKVSEDWEGNLYCVVSLEWNYEQ